MQTRTEMNRTMQPAFTRPKTPPTPRGPLANTARVYRLMDEAKLSALVLCSGENFTYLSGVVFPGTLARLLELANSPRATILVWPRDGVPTIIVNVTAEGLTRRDAPHARIEIYDGYRESPYAKLAAVLNEAGFARERVGFEKNFVNALEWQRVADALLAMTMVDCTELMDKARWIKTSQEVELLKVAADLLDDVYLKVFPTIARGDRERDIHARILYECLIRGFGWAHGILNSSRNAIPYAGESDFVIEAGDVIRTDYVAYLHGYPGHLSRNVIVGEPTAEQLRHYRANRDVYRAAIDRCRPGARVGDIYDFIVSEFAKYGWAYNSIISGHSIGPWMHQQNPIITRGSEHILEEGMVLAMEPHWRHWHLQDLVLVSKSGPQLLSTRFSTDEPFVVA
jgi:Xaa-Pro aminopeptidase